MALQAGMRLGPYEIVSLIGSGGMGEVYRARDTRLDRSVAVKVLAPELAGDADFRARFTREAKAISALNHPHVCGLYDIGHQDGIHFLVMEYLDGETLTRRLARGKIPLDQAVQNGIQIADALAAAHKAGIIHRDVKPGNVLLTRSGLKLLDFGLAKAAPPILRRPAETELATEAHLTGEGTLVGTVQYMAPEQLEGQELDPRTDIFALGAILYEMVTGRKAFIGDSQASLITAIMSFEPPRLVSVAPLTPPLLDRLIHACLAKNPDDRVQTAQDVLLQLRWIAESSQAGLAAAVLPRRRRLWERAAIAWTVSAIAMVVAVGAVWLASARGRLPTNAAKVVRSTILLPERVTLNNAVISPDGERIVFSGRDRAGRSQLWLRRLDAEDAFPLAGTEGGLLPFWSPDGHHIGFFVASPVKTLRRVAASGEQRCRCTMSTAWAARGHPTMAFCLARPVGRSCASRRRAATRRRSPRSTLHAVKPPIAIPFCSRTVATFCISR
jgi:eukaryotic-like serine/threonine-protein kinase